LVEVFPGLAQVRSKTHLEGQLPYPVEVYEFFRVLHELSIPFERVGRLGAVSQ